MANRQDPPTYTLPIIKDERTGEFIFNPVWLDWFLSLNQNVSGGVSTTRKINTTPPLTGGGDLSVDRTLSLTYTPVNKAGDTMLGPLNFTLDTSPVVIPTVISDTTGNNIQQRRAKGVIGVPVAIIVGNIIGQNSFAGYDGTSYLNGAGSSAGSAAMQAIAEENYSPTNRGAFLRYRVTQTGTSTLVTPTETHWDRVQEFVPIQLMGYTVAGLAALTPNQGWEVYVTDALAPAWNVALVGGGAVVCKAFYNGAAWVAG